MNNNYSAQMFVGLVKKVSFVLAVCMTALTSSGFTAQAAEITGAVARSRVTGTINYNFNLRASSPADEGRISISGRAVIDDRFVTRQRLDYAGVLAYIEMNNRGEHTELSLHSSGGLAVSGSTRRAWSLRIAGLRLNGAFTKGFIRPSYDLRGLLVDGRSSTGELEYSIFSAEYKTRGAVSYGAYPIAPIVPGGYVILKRVSHVDTMYTLSMTFDDLDVRGQVRVYNDNHAKTVAEISLVTAHVGGGPVDLTDEAEKQKASSLMSFIMLFATDWVY